MTTERTSEEEEEARAAVATGENHGKVELSLGSWDPPRLLPSVRPERVKGRETISAFSAEKNDCKRVPT